MKHFLRKAGTGLALLASASAMANSSSGQVSLTGLHLETTSKNVSVITGYAHNDTTTLQKHVLLKFNLYKGKTVIGQIIDVGENIEPGEYWKVTARIDTLRGRPDLFKVTDIEVAD